jgi:hypothetical protein
MKSKYNSMGDRNMNRKELKNLLIESRIFNNGVIFLSLLMMYSLIYKADVNALKILFFTFLFMVFSLYDYNSTKKKSRK